MFSRLMERLQSAAARSQSGQSMIEYALIAALIAVVVMVTLGPLGTAIASKFTEITAKLGGG
jgi:pilus assembly protein Flp/PilA